MKRLFFIYSLPRSGSSWLSEFLSQPGSYCYHDPLADGPWDHLFDRMWARPENVVGAIDTLAATRKPAPLVGFDRYVLLRDPNAVLASLRVRGYTLHLGMEVERLKFVARDAVPIRYEWLHDLNYLGDVWRAVTGLPYDLERAERLIEMNIQREFAAVKIRIDRARLRGGED